ncbi:hypothetical protein CVO96_20230 [Deinococcus koreensis]|uniref:Uncharacterized protein n=1 Tax=Deinococcus koreensis TaxID=2054903 RepID=A0A2K3URV6_9DEIO|nr:hypothetical protein CVO96_20230 [Deinococcus koreensis]
MAPGPGSPGTSAQRPSDRIPALHPGAGILGDGRDGTGTRPGPRAGTLGPDSDGAPHAGLGRVPGR